MLKTQLLRGLFALPLLAAMLIAQALVPAEPAPPGKLDTIATDFATLANECAEQVRSGAQTLAVTWLLTRTPLDLPAQRKPRQAACRGA